MRSSIHLVSYLPNLQESGSRQAIHTVDYTGDKRECSLLRDWLNETDFDIKNHLVKGFSSTNSQYLFRFKIIKQTVLEPNWWKKISESKVELTFQLVYFVLTLQKYTTHEKICMAQLLYKRPSVLKRTKLNYFVTPQRRELLFGALIQSKLPAFKITALFRAVTELQTPYTTRSFSMNFKPS